MKYLLLIIRRFFPRRQWTVLEKHPVYMLDGDRLPIRYDYVLKDQFGNVKIKKL